MAEETDWNEKIDEIRKSLSDNEDYQDDVAAAYVILAASENIRRDLPMDKMIAELNKWICEFRKLGSVLEAVQTLEHAFIEENVRFRAKLVRDLKQSGLSEGVSMEIVGSEYEKVRKIGSAMEKFVLEVTKKTKS